MPWAASFASSFANSSLISCNVVSVNSLEWNSKCILLDMKTHGELVPDKGWASFDQLSTRRPSSPILYVYLVQKCSKTAQRLQRAFYALQQHP